MTAIARRALVAGLLAFTIVGVSADQAGPPLSRVMRDKLTHSQAILAAVVTSDWKALDRESRAVATIVRDPSWLTSLTEPEYLRESDAFSQALQDLIQASSRRDLQAAADAHVAFTRSCVQCHLHLSRRRLAR